MSLHLTEIQRQGALVCALSLIIQTKALCVRCRIGAPAPGAIGVVGWFDLNDIRPKQRKLICAERPGQHMGQIKDSY